MARMEEALTALLASSADGRRYWGRAPQDINASTGPYLVLSRIDGVRDYALGGATGYVVSRVQVDCYAATYTAAKAAGRALVASVSGHRDSDIQGIFVEAERDLPAEDAGEASHLFRVTIDLMIHHAEG